MIKLNACTLKLFDFLCHDTPYLFYCKSNNVGVHVDVKSTRDSELVESNLCECRNGQTQPNMR